MRKLPAIGIWFCLFIFTACILSVRGHKPKRATPNIVLITIDTLRQDALSCYGAERGTPNIDRLAARSVKFADAYCTMPITLPSHTSLLTGLYPKTHKVKGNGQVNNFKTLAEALKEHGYETAAVVSSFVLNSMFGLDKGFDKYRDVPELFIDPAETTERALTQLEGMDEPFFLWVHYFDPHAPYAPVRREYGINAQIEPTHGVLANICKTMQGLDGGIPYSQDDLRDLRNLYDDEVCEVDDEVGKLLTHLDYTNTIIILCSDHGEHFGEHGIMGHGFGLHRENIAVPLLLYVPLQAPYVEQASVSLVDVTPTLLNLLGIDHQLEGYNLLNLPRQRTIHVVQHKTKGSIWQDVFPAHSISFLSDAR